MCVDSLRLKFNIDEKQLTRLFISLFASDLIIPPIIVLPCGGWALRRYAGIGMTINLPIHPISVDTALF